MKRFVAALMLAGGLLVAGGAKAVGLGNSNFDCFAGPNGTPANVVGNIGDTYTVTSTVGFGTPCTGPSYTVAGVVTNNPATLLRAPSVITFTLAAAGSTQVTLTNGANIGSIVLTFNVNGTAAPTPIPSLSEWAQLMLALITIMLVVWHFHRERSY